MIESVAHAPAVEQVEDVLRVELANGDALLGTMAPILRHLLANDDHSVFSDEIIARVRSAFADIARQLLDAYSAAAGQEDRRNHEPELIDGLIGAFVADPGMLAHAHALALEWQLTERMQARLVLDPVLPPLLQTLIATTDRGVAPNAVALLAAQARFTQAQRRMRLPLAELPADLLHSALTALREQVSGEPGSAQPLAIAEQAIRGRYDEGRSRLGLIARLLSGMGGGVIAALDVAHAGVAIFLSALALASGQNRDLAVLATNEGQLARLALALRAAGLGPDQVDAQFSALHPDVALPVGFERLGADHAAALLARSSAPFGA